MTTVFDKMHMKYVFHNKFRIIFHDQKILSVTFKSSRIKLVIKYWASEELLLFKNIMWNGFY